MPPNTKLVRANITSQPVAEITLPSTPEVRVTYQRAGMESLAAIDEELCIGTDSVPDIQIGEAPLGRDTLQAIEEELATPIIHVSWPDSDSDTVRNMPVAVRPAAPAPKSEAGPPSVATLEANSPEIFEMITFVVRGNAGAHLITEVLRRRFVERYLMRRLPVESMAEVERVDVSPGSLAGTLVLRVWCLLQG